MLITVAVMILGAGYFLFDSRGSGFTAENPNAAPVVSELSLADSLIGKAKETKDMVEQKATETVGPAHNSSSSDSGKQGSGDSQQSIVNSQPAHIPTSSESDSGRQKTGNEDTGVSIKDRLVSFGYAESSGRKIDTVVLHSSYNNQGGDKYSVDKVIDIWKSYEVAPHYLIDRKGNILRLVEDEDIAYHAGNSKMPDGRTDVNTFSIGVEILNAEDDKYTDAQYAAVNDLVSYLKKQYGVKYVVGHADIAPGRKTDPWNFDWKKLK